MNSSRGWQRGLRRVYLIAWVIVAWNGAVVAVLASREPAASMHAVTRFLAEHAGQVSLADLQRHSGRLEDDFVMYRQLHGRAAHEDFLRDIATQPQRDCIVLPSDHGYARLHEIQDVRAAANDPRFKLAIPRLAFVWAAWGLLCVVLPAAALRLGNRGLRALTPAPSFQDGR